MNYIDLSRRYWQMHRKEAFTPSDTHLYWCLVDAFNDKGEKQIWPDSLTYTDGSLAALACINVKTMDAARTRLANRGLINHSDTGQGNRKGVTYRLTSPKTSVKNGEVTGEVASTTSVKIGDVNGEVVATSVKNGEVNYPLPHQLPQQLLQQHTQKLPKFYIYIEPKQETPNTNLVSTLLVANRDEAAARILIRDQLRLNIKKTKAPPSARPPDPEPPPPPKGEPVGDGRLRKACLAYNKENPDKYPVDMYRAFLAYWTAKVQVSTKKSEIGKEFWETQRTWDLAGRLARWHQNNQKDEQRNQPVGRKSANFLNHQRAAEPAKNGYGKL